MDLIKIDVIGSQAAETRVARFEDVAAGGSDFVDAGLDAEETLGGEDDVLAARPQRLASTSSDLPAE